MNGLENLHLNLRGERVKVTFTVAFHFLLGTVQIHMPIKTVT